MRLGTSSPDLWSLVWGKPEVDPRDLAAAVEGQVNRTGLDYRTRLLIRDSVDALKQHWGTQRFNKWLENSLSRGAIETIWREDFEECGFPTLKERIMEKTDPEVVRQFFRDLGTHLRRPVRIAIGGSIALILRGHLSRATSDIDVVNEVPEDIRSQPQLLDKLRQEFGLLLAHFQSHYLPSGWDNRLHYLETFGQLQVYLVDVYDVFLSKLFSIRRKDMSDMRLVAPQLDKETLVRRLKDTTVSMLAAESLRECAEKNWYILFGEKLPA